MSVVQKLFPSNVDLVDIVVESKQEGVSCTLSVSTKFWLQPLTQIICSRLDSCAPESNGYSFQEHLNTLSLVASMPDGPELLTNSASLQKALRHAQWASKPLAISVVTKPELQQPTTLPAIPTSDDFFANCSSVASHCLNNFTVHHFGNTINKSGPTVLVVGGVHGNEVKGVQGATLLAHFFQTQPLHQLVLEILKISQVSFAWLESR